MYVAIPRSYLFQRTMAPESFVSEGGQRGRQAPPLSKLRQYFKGHGLNCLTGWVSLPKWFSNVCRLWAIHLSHRIEYIKVVLKHLLSFLHFRASMPPFPRFDWIFQQPYSSKSLDFEEKRGENATTNKNGCLHGWPSSWIDSVCVCVWERERGYEERDFTRAAWKHRNRVYRAD